MNRTETASAAASRCARRAWTRARPVAPRRADGRTRTLLAATAALSIALLGAAPGHTDAKQASRSVQVGTTVQAYARLNATNPAKLVIANKDTSTGYLAVPNASNPSGTTLAIQTNDRAGYTVLVQVAAANQSQFSSIEISGLGGKVVLPGTGGTIAVPYTALNTTFTLTYRFVFAPKAKDGSVAWPLTFSVHPNP
ncbi:hypothetical protein B7G54_26990 [Burkholderia puraquae]|uniref:Uncharacterized protein n=1 Tax=Burkholderia puraquae TaxID=1904757 RepID=A0A1X1PAD2_9BURK|nr:hypothetical protein [Burkholderia puraquae]ORT82446.1 hypothetical protein B7G54_26990 [Burkholderia puraquae]CAB3759888.1 hypothetical protein LMG29660_03822 [Burkholderia puraquae]